jgi:glycosyltransferase involved in cell wall biosynthesis
VRLLLISYGFMMQRAYQWKGVELAQLCERVAVILPEEWKELWSGERINPESGPVDSLEHYRLPLLLNINKHFALVPPRALRRILQGFKPDVIEYDNEPFNLGSAQVIAMTRRYSPDTRVFLHAAQNLLKRYPPPFNWLEQYVIRRCAGVFARNNAAIDVLTKRGMNADKIHLMGHGVSLMEFAEARERQQNSDPVPGSVLYVGALTQQKGVDTLLQACARCREFRTLTLAGDGPERQALIRLADDLGIASRATFLGRVSHTNLKELYGCHSCLVLPSRTTPTLVEQFGRVLLEAMASGCPVIASSSGNISRVVGEAGLIFQEGRVAELTDLLERVLSGEASRRELRERGIRRVRDRFEWSVVAREMMSVFENAATGAKQ